MWTKSIMAISLSWISAATFAELRKFGKNPKLRWPRTFWGEKLVFHWINISYFKFTYIFPLVFLFIFKFPIHNLQLARWFLLTLKRQTPPINLILKTASIKFDVPIAIFKNLLNMAVLEQCLNKTDIEKAE